MNIWHELQIELDARAASNLARELRRVPDGALDLASNDYLGLARHPRVVEAAQIAAAKFGTGARASRLVSGHYDLIEELEFELARFKNCEASLVFSSGYAANVGVIPALANENSALFCHKRNHASLLDACELAKSPTRFWESNEKLRALLASSHAGRKLIICDGVFSMDGDLCDLPAIVALAAEFDAIIVLDDAHGTGTLGATGRGTAEYYGIDEAGEEFSQRALSFRAERGTNVAEESVDRAAAQVAATSRLKQILTSTGVGPTDSSTAFVPLSARNDKVRAVSLKQTNTFASNRIITLGTLSKALGSQGGFVCGPRVLIDYLVGAARSFVYSTGLNPPAAGAALAALRIIKEEPERVQRCRDNAAFLARELGALGYNIEAQPSPILPVYAADSAAALRMSARLLERNLWCPAIRPPTVKRARLRLTSRASWDDETLKHIVRSFGAKP